MQNLIGMELQVQKQKGRISKHTVLPHSVPDLNNNRGAQ